MPTVRVRTETLDRFLNTVGEVILTSSALRTAASALQFHSAGTVLSSKLDRMDRVVGDLRRRALDLRTTPFLRIAENLPRVAREVAIRSGKRVDVELIGAELEFDRSILDRLSDSLVHLVRNAVDHGIEPPEMRRSVGKPEVGNLRISAAREKDFIVIEVSDDGAGLDLEAIKRKAIAAGFLHPDLADDLPAEELAEFVFRSGVSTAKQVSDVSGRGVGMDAVRAAAESLGGFVRISTRSGVGMSTVLVVPITAAVQRVLLAKMADDLFAIPISRIERIEEIPTDEIEITSTESFALINDVPVIVIDLAEKLGLTRRDTSFASLILVEIRGQIVGLRVEGLLGQQELFMKPVPELLSSIRALAGLTVLGDGRPVFLIDLNHVV